MSSPFSSEHQNRFIPNDPYKSTFPPPQSVASSTNQQLKRSQYHTITQTSSFQPGSIQMVTNSPIVRPLSSHKPSSGLVISQGSRTPSHSPDSRPMTPNILAGSRSRSPITTTTIGAPIPGPVVVGPPIVGTPIPGPIMSRVISGIPPSPTQIIRELPVQNITRTEVIKESITDEREINRLQTANQTLIENYTNLYTKFKDLESNSMKQQTKSVESQSVNQVQLIRTLRGRIEQICDFELETALSRLHSATPKINIFSKTININ